MPPGHRGVLLGGDPRVRGEVVVGELGRLRRVTGSTALQSPRDPQVQGSPLPGQQIIGSSAAGQLVPKHDPVGGLLDNQLRRDQLSEQPDERRLVEIRHLTEEVEVGPPPGHRGKLQEAPGIRAQPPAALPHRGLHRPRHRHQVDLLRLGQAIGTVRGQRADHLDDQQRVAIGDRLHAFGEPA